MNVVNSAWSLVILFIFSVHILISINRNALIFMGQKHLEYFIDVSLFPSRAKGMRPGKEDHEIGYIGGREGGKVRRIRVCGEWIVRHVRY